MSSPVQYLQKMLEKAAIHQEKEKFSDRLLKHSAFNTQTNNKPAVSSQQQLGSLEAPENKPLTSAPITQNKPITQTVAQQPAQITGANQTHKAYSNPVRSSSPPKPPAPAQTTKIPNVLKVARATGIIDADGNPYVNVEDVSLLGKLGFEISVEEYEGLEKSSEVLDLYSYIEKCAGVPKIPSQAVDRGEAFSGEYLKDMGYEIPKGYEIKGDLVCPVEKKAEELQPNTLRLSNGTFIDLGKLSYTLRNRDVDYETLITPSHIKGEFPIRSAQSSLTNEGNGWGEHGSPKIIKSPQYTYIDDTGKKVGVTTGYHRPAGDHGFDSGGRQIRHIVNYFSTNANKVELPETFAKEIYEHLGGDDFAKSIHLHDAEKLRNAWRERAKEKGFFSGKTPYNLVFDKHLTKALEDVVRTADDPAWANKPIGGPPVTLLQKLKPYNKSIGIGAGVTGLAALGYYLHNKNKEHSAQETPFTEKEAYEKTAKALVVSGIHGDEPAGNKAARKLKDSADVVTHVNPSEKRRFEGKDINRHFDKPTEGPIQKKLLDYIEAKKPSSVISLHEDDEVDKPYAYSSESMRDKVKQALKDKDTATSAHGDITDKGVISKGKNPPAGSLERALDRRGIPHTTIETPSQSEHMDDRTKTHMDVIKSLLSKESSERPGLWANIRAKKARGEQTAKPGSEDYPDKKQWDKLTKAAVAAWQRSEGKNPEGGLNAKGRASYKKETGGTLKAPVTESNPSGERAKRQNSFCSRMCGMKRKNTGSEGQSNPDSRINKSLRKWNCKCGEAHESLFEKVACMLKESKGRCWEGYEPVPGKEVYSEDSCRPKAKKKESELEKEAVDAYELRKLIIAASNGCRESKQALSIMASKGKGSKLLASNSTAKKAVGESVQGAFPFDGSHQMEIVKKNIDPSYTVDRSKYLGR